MDNLATTCDTVYKGKITLEQPVDGYRFGTDAMLLAASLQAKPGESVLELGCGVGAVLLTAAQRCPDATLTGIEREETYAELARANVERNALDGRVTVIQGDATGKHDIGTFHHVLANPPYFPVQKKTKVSDLRRAAREEKPDTLQQWMNAANCFLKPKGTVTFVHSADRLDELLDGLRLYCGGIRIFPFWPTAGQAAKRVIVQGTKGSRAPLLLLPGLVLHDSEGQHYADKASAIINTGQSLWE